MGQIPRTLFLKNVNELDVDVRVEISRFVDDTKIFVVVVNVEGRLRVAERYLLVKCAEKWQMGV